MAIAISCAVMILTASVVRGFRQEISEKVIGFGSHIQVGHYDTRNSYESRPIIRNDDIEQHFRHENVENAQAIVTKAGIFKNKDHIQASILKGVDAEYDWGFFSDQIMAGSIEGDLTNAVVLSVKSANALNVKVGEKILLYFIQDPPRVRKLEVKAIYETGFSQFDELIAITDMTLLQRINDWDEDMVSSYEIKVKEIDELQNTSDEIYMNLPPELNAMSIYEKHPDIFNWLELQNINFIIIVALMILVAAVNGISALIILILEKSSTIGVFKALGARNGSIRRIFILQGLYLLFTGLFWGNLFGLVLCYLQNEFEIIKLPVESYYLSAVPVKVELFDLFMINGTTILLCFLALVLPSQIISRINVVKVIKFE